jgi:hypothetical protein
MSKYKVIPTKEIPNFRFPLSGWEPGKWAIIESCEGLSAEDINLIPNVYEIDGTSYIVKSVHPTKGATDKAIQAYRQSSPPESPLTYQLSLTEKQAQVIIDALDLYSRVGMGQLEDVAHVLRLYSKPSEKYAEWNRIDMVQNLMREAAVAWVGNAGSYYGITNQKISDVFRVAFDLQQVIRHRLAWDKNPEGGVFVRFDEPMKYSQEPLAKINKANCVG